MIGFQSLLSLRSVGRSHFVPVLFHHWVVWKGSFEVPSVCLTFLGWRKTGRGKVCLYAVLCMELAIRYEKEAIVTLHFLRAFLLEPGPRHSCFAVPQLDSQILGASSGARYINLRIGMDALSLGCLDFFRLALFFHFFVLAIVLGITSLQ